MKSSFSVHNIFGDHMVIQRDKPIRIAGTAFPGTRVSGEFGTYFATAEAGRDGEWVMEFPALEAGGPYELTLFTQCSPRHTIHDIMIGDVWYCSGQSNMEFSVWNETAFFYCLRGGDKIAAAANDDSLRLFNVPRAVAPDSPCSEMPFGGAWKPASSFDAVAPFSAVAYYFGVKLRESLGVPVGLINGSWGGTRIEPWIPRAGYIDFGREDDLKAYDLAVASQFAAPDPNAKPFDPYGGEYKEWIENKYRKFAPEITADAVANWAKPGNEPSKWSKCKSPLTSYLRQVGTVWFRCEIELPPEAEGCDATLHYDHCDDSDEAFFDGVKVGEVTPYDDNFWTISRNYTFKIGHSENGRHTIVCRVQNQFNVGSIGGNMRITVAGGAMVNLDDADWHYRVEYYVDEKKIGVRPSPASSPHSQLFDCQTPTTLYNSMVHPATYMNIKGAIWYQGCSNAGAPDLYELQQKMQIESWRKIWRDPAMPFLITQLSAFYTHVPEKRIPDDFWKDHKPETAYGYAHFRQMQERFLDYPGAGVACTIDIGDHSDIHPADKKSVGFRLAHEAMRVAYGDASAVAGPRFKSVKRVAGGAELEFANIGGGLVADNGVIGPHTLAVYDSAGNSSWTTGELRADGTLFVADAGLKDVKRVEYAYSAFPPAPSIRRKDDGLPLFPFRVEL